MFNIVAVGGLSLNGTAPVNTCIDTKRRFAKAIHAADHLGRTSTITTAKEKISASLLSVPSIRTSGAAHRGV